MSEETIIRTAVVTGGSRGIGRAVCIQLAKQGCNVVVNYCHGEAAAAETVALCKAENADAVAVQADVSTAEGCKALFEQAVNAFGRVDILVNNAGITRDNLILRMSEEDFDAVLNANLKGAFLCCKEAARRMVRQRWGRIVNLSSVVALRGNAGQTNYAASKAGLIGLTKSLARELSVPKWQRASPQAAQESRRMWQMQWHFLPQNKAAISPGRCSVQTAAWQCKRRKLSWKNAES